MKSSLIKTESSTWPGFRSITECLWVEANFLVSTKVDSKIGKFVSDMMFGEAGS